jgi:transposase
MEITEEQHERIKDALPVQRGNVRLSNLQVLNAVLYVTEQGCKWRGLPKRFERWHTIYIRMNGGRRTGFWTASSRSCRWNRLLLPE